jgi:carbon storage regulator
MLILTRKTNESIIVGDEVRITIIEIKGNRVRLGVEASPDISADREEVWRDKMKDNPEIIKTMDVIWNSKQTG